MNAGVIDRVQNNDGDWVVAAFYDGSNDYLQFTDVVADGADPWSTFLVSKRTASGQIGGIIGGTGTSGLLYQYSDNNFYISRTNGASYGYKNTSGDATATFSLITGLYPTYLGYKNGSVLTFGGESFTAATSNAFNAIGRAAASYTNGYITEAIIYSSDQISNRTSIESNINTYWKIY